MNNKVEKRKIKQIERKDENNYLKYVIISNYKLTENFLTMLC